MHGTLKALRTHGSPLKSHPSPARGPSGADGRLIRQPEQQYCCQLNLKVTRFIVVRCHDPLIQPHYPRRNQYGPVGRWDGWHPTEVTILESAVRVGELLQLSQNSAVGFNSDGSNLLFSQRTVLTVV